MNSKEPEKKEKYQEMKELWNMTVGVMIVVMVALGTQLRKFNVLREN